MPIREETQELAEKIARDLMTNGAGEPAERLALLSADGRDLGGWSLHCLTTRLLGFLGAVERARDRERFVEELPE